KKSSAASAARHGAQKEAPRTSAKKSFILFNRYFSSWVSNRNYKPTPPPNVFYKLAQAQNCDTTRRRDAYAQGSDRRRRTRRTLRRRRSGRRGLGGRRL